MTALSGQSVLRLITTLIISLLLFSCGNSENTAQESNSTGILFKLKWPVAKSVGSVPAEVITVKMSVSGPGMVTMSKNFAASAGTGSIDGVPVGVNRTITIQGLDSTKVIYQKDISGVTLELGNNKDCGTVTMDKIATPVAPSGLTAFAASFNQVNLAWVDNEKYESGYKIERKTGADGTYDLIATATPNTTSYSDTTPVASTLYYYRVRAMTVGFGDSEYCNEVSATTQAVTYILSGVINNGAVALAGVKVTLSGDSSSSSTTGSDGNYSFSQVVAGSYTLTPSMPGYSFTPASTSLTISGINPPAKNFMAVVSSIPDAPTNLVASSASDIWINLVWSDNGNNETGYKIERKTGANGVYVPIGTAGVNATTYSDSPLAALTNYSYRVRATNSIGDSDYSNESNATTYDISRLLNHELVKVSGGTYRMGNNSQVTVGVFYIGRYELTQGEWNAVMGVNPSKFSACGLDCPVERVSWNDVQAFISKLNSLSGKNYRLPTEAEWEYAARSGGLDQTYSGGSDVDAVAWYSGNSGGTTHRVGLKLENGLGIYDMSGNVAEWVSDLYGSTNRVLRGGSLIWLSPMQTTSFSAHDIPGQKYEYLGFRLASTTP